MAFLKSQVPEGKRPIFLNLDETCIRFYYPQARGLKVRQQMRRSSSSREAGVKHASKGQQRKAMTYVAIVCDDASIQPVLPQVILLAEAVARVGDVLEADKATPENIIVTRQKSGWINSRIFPRIIKVLGQVLQLACPERQPILLMDAHHVHCGKATLSMAASCGIWVCFVPASCTHFLQPLDTDVFSPLKAAVKRGMYQKMCERPNEDLPLQDIIAVLVDAIRAILQVRRWRGPFCKNGFSQSGFSLRESLLTQLHWDVEPELPTTLPSLAAFQTIFPRRHIINFDVLFKSVVSCAGSQPGAKATPPVRLSEPFAESRGDSQAGMHTSAVASSGPSMPIGCRSFPASAAQSSGEPWRQTAAMRPWAMTRSRSRRLLEESSQGNQHHHAQPEQQGSHQQPEQARRLPRATRLPTPRSYTRSTS